MRNRTFVNVKTLSEENVTILWFMFYNFVAWNAKLIFLKTENRMSMEKTKKLANKYSYQLRKPEQKTQVGKLMSPYLGNRYFVMLLDYKTFKSTIQVNAKSKALNRPCNFETSVKSAVAVLSE